jgi:putative Mg2+ transporter-C (MgtC) family protein
MNWTTWLDAASTGQHELEIAVRLVLAGFLGAVIGYERESKDRPAGLRTHTLVATAAALFTVLTFEIHNSIGKTGDPVRIISAVTGGVAFLAAGSIIQSGGQVKGITTGAAMWMAGALGIAAGAGYYAVAVLATLMTYLVLKTMTWLNDRVLSSAPTNRDKT